MASQWYSPIKTKVRTFLPSTAFGVLLLICFTLLIISYCLTTDDVLQERWIDAKNGYSVAVTLPKEMPFERDPTYPLPITVRVKPTKEIQAGVPYTLTVSTDDALAFLGEDGRSLSRPVTASGTAPAPVELQLFLQRRIFGSSLDHGNVILAISDSATYLYPNLSVRLATEYQTKESQFRRDLLSPTGLGQVVVAIIALGLTWEAESRKREDTKRRARLEELRQLYHERSPEAMRLVMQIGSDIQRGGWEELQDQRFEDLRQRLTGSRDYQVALMSQLGEDLAAGAKDHVREVLHLCASCFAGTGTLGSWFGSLCPFIPSSEQPQQSDPTQIDAAIDACLGFWREYGEDAREMLVPLLAQIGEQRSGDDKIAARFKQFVGAEKRVYGSLLRDQRLQHLIAAQDVPDYEWPPLPITQEQTGPDSESTKWLQDHHKLKINPFTVTEAEKDSLLSKTWTNPDGWELRVKANRPTVFASSIDYDRVATALGLYADVSTSKGEQSKTFPVQIQLPFAHSIFGPGQSGFLQGVASTIAKAWIDLLQLHPEAVLGLPRIKQGEVAQFLAWAAGSPAHLLAQWPQMALTAHKGDGSHTLMLTLNELLTSFPHRGEPATTTLLSWLSLRPASTARTFLIAYCARSENTDSCAEQTGYMLDVADLLASNQTFVKLFTAQKCDNVDLGIEIVDIRWEIANIVRFIDKRIDVATVDSDRKSQGDKGLSGLFGLGIPFDHSKQLAQCAAGSLHTALQLAARLIDVHVQNTPDEECLNEEDWQAVFGKVVSS